jgi:hypothetical protein
MSRLNIKKYGVFLTLAFYSYSIKAILLKRNVKNMKKTAILIIIFLLSSPKAVPEEERPDFIQMGGSRHSTELTKLNLSGVLFHTREQITPLRHMTNLKELRMWDNPARDLAPLSGLINLTYLSLSSNEISNLTPLSGLTNLTHLNLNGNQISDLTPLSGLTNLTHLNLNGNQISDLTMLSGLTNLTVLELDANQISDLTPLSGLINLKELSFNDNQIKDITPLAGLPNLSYLSSSGNPISDNSLQQRLNSMQKSLAKVNVGEIINFGGYSWLVLDVQDNHALIITENIHLMGMGRYNHIHTGITWESCFMRRYMNNEFLNSFIPSDRDRIRETLVITGDHPWYGTKGGNNTRDRVFLLSLSELVQYFGDSGKLQNRPDDRLIQHISDEFDSARRAKWDDGRYSFWWLRSPGSEQSLAAGVDGTGAIYVSGTGVSNSTLGSRPALWLNLEF